MKANFFNFNETNGENNYNFSLQAKNDLVYVILSLSKSDKSRSLSKLGMDNI
jgi:hypothetical protein